MPAFWHWPGKLTPGDRPQLTAHIDIFPTLAQLAAARLSEAVARQVEGRSLLPLLASAEVAWPERFLFTHVGRWDRGQAAQSKYRQCAVQNSRFSLVNNAELYDLQADPGETRNVIAEQPQVAAELRAAYDGWWESVLPCLVNELAVGPRVNPFKAAYWAQFGGGPDATISKLMDPARFK